MSCCSSAVDVAGCVVRTVWPFGCVEDPRSSRIMVVYCRHRIWLPWLFVVLFSILKLLVRVYLLDSMRGGER